MAKLYYRYGAMNSGKSLFLISTAYNFKTRGINYLVLKPSIDTRDKEIKSRAMSTQLECIPVNETTDIIHIISQQRNPDLQWVLVDESQFLSPKQVDELAHIVDFFNINVICYGLRTDFKTNLFPGSKRLFEIADTIEEMKTTCSCGKRAHVNARIDKDGNIMLDGAQVECGAEDKYITLCRKCFNKRTFNSKSHMENLSDTQTYSKKHDLNYCQTCTDKNLNIEYVYEASKDINYIVHDGEALNSVSPEIWICPECDAINSPNSERCACCGKPRKL